MTVSTYKRNLCSKYEDGKGDVDMSMVGGFFRREGGNGGGWMVRSAGL